MRELKTASMRSRACLDDFRSLALDTVQALISDQRLLEMLISRLYPQETARCMAEELLRRFGSFAEVIGAMPERLGEMPGASAALNDEFMLVQLFTQRFLRGEVRCREPIRNLASLVEYCRGRIAFRDVEHFRVLFLDKRECLIADELHGTGTIDHAPVYPREVVRRALVLSSSSMILVHNHPSGDPTPSSVDIRMTAQIIGAARPLGVSVRDHLIVARNGYSSFKELGLI